MFNFGWWRNEDNREGAKAITDVLKVVVPAALVVGAAVAGYFGLVAKPQANATPDPAPVECNSTFTQSGDGNQVQNCGEGDVEIQGGSHGDAITCNSRFRQDGDGKLIQNCGDGTVIVGLTQEKFFAELAKREAALRAEQAERERKLREDLSRTSAAEQRALQAEKRLAELELAQVRSQMADIDAAYQQTVEDLRQLRQELAQYTAVLSADRLQAAQQALFQGDRSEADLLLAEVERATADSVKLAASAAFIRGEIAEQEVRWQDAFAHYDRAARLDPNFQHLHSAREYAWLTGAYDLAYRYGEDLVRIARDEGNPRQLAQALNADGLSIQALGRYKDAEFLFQQAMEIIRSSVGETHPDFAATLNNLALAVQAQGRFIVAEALYRQALDIGKETIGDQHPGYATRLGNLASVIARQGRHAEAEALYFQALEVTKATLGETHPDYATRLNNLARVVRAQGRFVMAEALYRQAVEIDRETLGERHPDFATSLSNLARVIEDRGRYQEAETLYLQSLEIAKSTLGPRHPSYAFHLNNRSVNLFHLGRLREAEKLMVEALEIRTAKLPAKHPDIRQSQQNLAVIRSKLAGE